MTTGRKGNVDAAAFLEEMDGPLTLGRYIESIRLGDEMTQVEFAKKLGITKAKLCDVEKGRRSLSPERAAEWARVLGYSEKQFIRLALQEIIDEAGLRYKVSVA